MQISNSAISPLRNPREGVLQYIKKVCEIRKSCTYSAVKHFADEHSFPPTGLSCGMFRRRDIYRYIFISGVSGRV